jgi:eukaryotic-like serine/threonine-protein kinase
MALIAQAADALEAAHAKGIVHRDVKPGNLLVRPNGTLVLTDFGIARSALVGQLTVAGAVLGTASYISPEQAAGNVATPASDVYALGVVAYQCLSGHRPFDGDTPIEIAMKHVRESPRPLPADIPPAVRAIVERAMAKEPGARWPSAATLAAVARQAAATLTSTVHPQPGPHAAATAHGENGHNRPQSGPPQTYPHQPVSPLRAPAQHPGVPRPVSGGQQARGAASVPSGGGPHYSRPSAPPAQRSQGSGSRQVLIVVAVVLAILVLLCAGVISFLYRINQNRALAGVVGGVPPVASYRVLKQAAAPPGLTPLTEGRRTR